MVQFLGVCLGILFLALAYLQWRVQTLTKQIKTAQSSATLALSCTIGLSQMLIDKGLLTDAEFVEFSLTGKVTKKDDKSKATV